MYLDTRYHSPEFNSNVAKVSVSFYHRLLQFQHFFIDGNLTVFDYLHVRAVSAWSWEVIAALGMVPGGMMVLGVNCVLALIHIKL